MTTMLTTRNAIECFRLVTLRSRCNLEKLGMKTQGGAIRPRIAAELGLKPRDTLDKFIEVLTVKIDAMKGN